MHIELNSNAPFYSNETYRYGIRMITFGFTEYVHVFLWTFYVHLYLDVTGLVVTPLMKI